ncbi:MAG: TolC family protein [Firmicutes bacterium]|nr:TolC family protein [Bacillota bacterium]
MKRKSFIGLFIAFSMIITPMSSFADVTRYTLDEAFQKSLENSKGIYELDYNIVKLEDGIRQSKAGAKKVEANLDDLQEFRKLYKNEQLGRLTDPVDIMTLKGYQAAFGEEPPYYSYVEKYNMFYYNSEVVPFNLDISLKKLNNTKDQVESQIRNAVYELYNNYLMLNSVLDINEKYLDLMNRQYEDILVKYENNQASEMELEITKLSRDSQENEVNKTKLNIEKIKLNLNKLMGNDINSDFELDFTPRSYGLENSLSETEFVKLALDNNIDLINAKYDVKTKEHEIDVMDFYIDDFMRQFRDLMTDYEDSKLTVSKLEYDIRENVIYGYNDMTYKGKLVELNKKTSIQKSKEMDKYNNFYEAGQIKMSDLIGVELQYVQQLVNEQKAIYDYYLAQYKFNNAIGKGPLY